MISCSENLSGICFDIFMEDAMAVQDMGWHSFCMSTMSSLCAFDGDFRQFLTDLDCPQVKFVCDYYGHEL